ncbi:hypothetical protein pb186bvf_019569 [Paramecium bursaria]
MKRGHQYIYNNKLDEIYYREKSYDLHMRKLNDIRNKKSASPYNFPHIQLLEKRNVIKEQRRRFDQNQKVDEINKQNGVLYQKICEISNRALSYDDDLNHPHYLNLTQRKIAAQQIQVENLKMASRLIKQEPVLKLEEFKNSYKQSKKLVQRLQKYQQSQNYVNNISRIQFQLPKSNRDPLNNSQLKSQSVKQRLTMQFYENYDRSKKPIMNRSFDIDAPDQQKLLSLTQDCKIEIEHTSEAELQQNDENLQQLQEDPIQENQQDTILVQEHQSYQDDFHEQ